MKRIVFVFFIGFFAVTGFAQQEPAAKAALEKSVALIKNSAVKIGFVTSITPASGKSHNVTGSIVTYGNKYKLSVNGSEVYFDGKTQWVYVPENNEVTISNVSAKDQKKVNPLAVLSQYSGRDTKILFSREGKNMANQLAIELFPTSGSANEFKIVVKLDKRSNVPQSLQLFSRDGSKTTITIKSFQKTVADSKQFSFDVKSHTKLNVNDLR